MNITETLAKELRLRIPQVENTVKLLDDGCTVPFIARYRKEMTGSLDDQVVRELSERLVYLRNLEEQREKVRATITEQGAMTDEIAAALDAAATVTEIDDIYRPFRPKRKTRASVARERGLEPLAALLYAQARDCPDPLVAAAEYIVNTHSCLPRFFGFWFLFLSCGLFMLRFPVSTFRPVGSTAFVQVGSANLCFLLLAALLDFPQFLSDRRFLLSHSSPLCGLLWLL